MQPTWLLLPGSHREDYVVTHAHTRRSAQHVRCVAQRASRHISQTTSCHCQKIEQQKPAWNSLHHLACVGSAGTLPTSCQRKSRRTFSSTLLRVLGKLSTVTSSHYTLLYLCFMHRWRAYSSLKRNLYIRGYKHKYLEKKQHICYEYKGSSMIYIYMCVCEKKYIYIYEWICL